MNLFTIGINHKTAPIDIREKFYLNATQQRLLLSELKNNPAVIESFVISTCNRTEVYLNVIDFYYPLEEVINLISSIKENKEILSFKNFIYIYREQKSVEHLLRVICGLDSLVLGEKQILGQLKDAFEVARAEGALSKYFNLLTNIALRTGKKAQTETNICYGGSSVSWAAIAMAEKVLDTLENKSVLILGAGKMSELAVKQLAQKKLKKLYLMNRSIDNALNLASKYSGEVVEYCDIKETLTEVDLCICSTNAPHYVLEKGTVQKVLRKSSFKKMMFIDISMPRNIAPEVATLSNVLLFTIDDLDKIVNQNKEVRMAAVGDVEKIVQTKYTEFCAKVEKNNIYNSSHSASYTDMSIHS